MTAEGKAKELFDKFYLQTEYYINCGCEFLAKENALICVDEIINNDYGSRSDMVFWQEVKQEINKNKMKNTKEPNYRTEKREWIIWNMLKYGNDAQTAYQLLRQKEIVDSYL